MNTYTITCVKRGMDTVKRYMEIKFLSTIIKQKIKKINNAHQRIVAREKRVFVFFENSDFLIYVIFLILNNIKHNIIVLKIHNEFYKY